MDNGSTMSHPGFGISLTWLLRLRWITAGAQTAAYRHVCLEVDDIVATVETLRARGVEATDPKLGSDHAWQSWIKDPEGNAIELHAYTPQSWQTPHL